MKEKMKAGGGRCKKLMPAIYHAQGKRGRRLKERDQLVIL
jgi:hypothetical protein